MKRPTVFMIAIFAWLSAALSGTWAMMSYANAPGDPGAAPARWPGASRLPGPAARPELVLFLHPRCPCSRASIGELALLMTHCAGAVDARVVFIDPEARDEGWVKTDTWRSAQAIPGVTVERDAGGSETKAFGAVTSGDSLLYDAGGRLVFHGGITLARGHSGDNPGRSAIEAILLRRGPGAAATTPVFGCGLVSCQQADDHEK